MSFDDELRATLQRRSDDVSARPELLGLTVRRARRNQIAVASVASACVVALAMVAVALARPSVDAVRPVRPVATPPPVPPLPAAVVEAMQRRAGDDGTIVTSGASPGLRWYLSAHEDESYGERVVCHYLHVDAGRERGRLRCDPVGEATPLDLALFVVDRGEGERTVAFGVVRRRVHSVVLRRTHGDVSGVRLYDAPSGVSPSVRFVVTEVPPDGRAVVAFDESGAELAREELPYERLGPAPTHPDPRTGPRVVLDDGSYEGIPYRLVGFTKLSGPCATLSLGPGRSFGAGGGCPGDPAEEIEVTQKLAPDVPDLAPTFAVLPASATSVTIEMDDGRTVRPEVRPASSDFPFASFVAFPPRGAGVAVIRDSSGGVIARVPLCSATTGTDMGTCGDVSYPNR